MRGILRDKPTSPNQLTTRKDYNSPFAALGGFGWFWQQFTDRRRTLPAGARLEPERKWNCMPQEPLRIETIASDPLLVTIRSIDFTGAISFSENLSFAVAYSDSCRTADGSLIGGARLSGEGDVLLLKRNLLMWRKKIPRPIKACVSSTGMAAICDIGFGPELRSNILAFRDDGSTAVNETIEANLLSCAITASGDFALFNSAGSPNSQDSVKLFAYTLPSGECSFRVDFFIQELTGAFFDGNKLTVIAEGMKYEYSPSGALLNKFETEMAWFNREISSQYFASAHRILNNCLRDTIKDQERAQLRAAYDRLISSDAPSDVRAKAHRDLGEQLLAQGENVQALAAFREALSLNPRIGLKRRVAELERSTGQHC